VRAIAEDPLDVAEIRGARRTAAKDRDGMTSAPRAVDHRATEKPIAAE